LRNNSVLGLTSRLTGKTPKPYTVGLNVIDDQTVANAGSVYFLNQMTSGRGNGNQEVADYYTPNETSGNGYYDLEQFGSTYFQNIPQPITSI
jgi:hypothetical protein